MIGKLIKFGWNFSWDAIEFWATQYQNWKELTCKHEWVPVTFYNNGGPEEAVICVDCGIDQPTG